MSFIDGYGLNYERFLPDKTGQKLSPSGEIRYTDTEIQHAISQAKEEKAVQKALKNQAKIDKKIARLPTLLDNIVEAKKNQKSGGFFSFIRNFFKVLNAGFAARVANAPKSKFFV